MPLISFVIKLSIHGLLFLILFVWVFVLRSHHCVLNHSWFFWAKERRLVSWSLSFWSDVYCVCNRSKRHCSSDKRLVRSSIVCWQIDSHSIGIVFQFHDKAPMTVHTNTGIPMIRPIISLFWFHIPCIYTGNVI